MFIIAYFYSFFIMRSFVNFKSKCSDVIDMPEEKASGPLAPITNMTKMLGEDKPGTNILIFVIIIVAAMIIFVMKDDSFMDKGFYQIAGFSLIGLILYILYQFGSRFLAIKERQETRANHNEVYQNLYMRASA